MKKNIILLFILATLLVITTSSCSSDDTFVEDTLETSSNKNITLHFDCIVKGYDGETKETNPYNRATTASWADGAILYITFYNGSTIVPAMATYSTSSGWSVNYEGDLAFGNGQKCEVRHFVDATQTTEYVVTLNPHTQIYEDLEANYTYSNGEIIVTATMTPKLGRIRFTGNEGEKLHFTGFTTYASFTTTNNTYYTTKQMIATEVASTKTTPYIYGAFTDADCQIGVIGSDYAYTRTCDPEMLKAGESGFMAIPTQTSHKNWITGIYITANGFEFKMIPVVGLNSGLYLMGETEVTRGLYYAVSGNVASSPNLPVTDIYASDVNSWISNLNRKTGLNFGLPTLEQWLYAAKGGNKSLNFTYSGSNTPEEVAWYNLNSGNMLHNVKEKAPNELGIYDMSGNAAEYTVENKLCGGYYCGDASTLIPSNYSGSLSLFLRGFRLVLNIK